MRTSTVPPKANFFNMIRLAQPTRPTRTAIIEYALECALRASSSSRQSEYAKHGVDTAPFVGCDLSEVDIKTAYTAFDLLGQET
jgi:hypothetical protein